MKNFTPKSWLAPQPVVIIGTYDANGTPNAMNAAWAGQWDATQIVVSLSHHATTENIDKTGAFTAAIATKATMVASDYVGIVSGSKDPEKIAKTGWTVVKSEHVNAPIFTDFPLTLECKVSKKIDESATGYYLVGEIVNICVDEKYLGADGQPDLGKMNLIIFDPFHHGYYEIGGKVGNAFSDGKAMKK